MGKIHLIPTNDPSRLYYKDNNYKLANSTMAMDWYISSVGYKPINIYITNDEDVKDGDYCFCTRENRVIWNQSHTNVPTTRKKLILTTDPHLIENGIQAIDDEFLEWFVNNPSCEEVEVELFPRFSNKLYKIIIPKQKCNHELRQRAYYREGVFKCWGCGSVICEPKQSGLEYLISELRLEEFAGTENLPAVAEIIKEARIRNRNERWEFWNGGIHCTEEGGKSFLEFYKERVGK